MKLKLKSKSHKAVYLKMWDKIQEGWTVINLPKKNIFGKWIVKLEK